MCFPCVARSCATANCQDPAYRSPTVASSPHHVSHHTGQVQGSVPKSTLPRDGASLEPVHFLAVSILRGVSLVGCPRGGQSRWVEFFTPAIDIFPCECPPIPLDYQRNRDRGQVSKERGTQLAPRSNSKEEPPTPHQQNWVHSESCPCSQLPVWPVVYHHTQGSHCGAASAALPKRVAAIGQHPRASVAQGPTGQLPSPHLRELPLCRCITCV